ncbi:MAG TPA: LLM class flavin-dependent oxidoreductase [Candidatus Saccharimonadales bacterium]|nr:LLM class flavin-dependent oxidoreductase [Candidatus Saccharimonadales bacterium]
MTKVGLGLPGISVADVRASAEAAASYGFDSFSVYGDLGDLPPYSVLHANADVLTNSTIPHIGPLGVPVGMQHAEVIAASAMALEEQLPGQSSIGLVKGAFLDQIGQRPATLSQMEGAILYIRDRFKLGAEKAPPIYIGGFGPKTLAMAGRLGVAGVKLGGSANPDLAKQARQLINNPNVEIILGAVSVIDEDRTAARALARTEVAKYLDVVGPLDSTLSTDEKAALDIFIARFRSGDPDAADSITDGLLDKFALAGTPEDALNALDRMQGVVDRFEFGTPQGLRSRPEAIHFIGQTIVKRRHHDA